MRKKSSLPAQAVFHKVAQNLYRVESSGVYYALFKRSGKQIRRSLKTTDPALARRRLGELCNKVARLNQVKGAGKITFADLAKRWLDNHLVHLKEKSVSRLDTCLKGLMPCLLRTPRAEQAESRIFHCRDHGIPRSNLNCSNRPVRMAQSGIECEPLPKLITVSHPQGIPVFVFPYEPKVDGLYAMVRQMYRNRLLLGEIAAAKFAS